MMPFFIEILLRPLHRHLEHKQAKKAERERLRLERIKLDIEFRKKMSRSGCIHNRHGSMCNSCSYAYYASPVRYY